MKFAVTAGFIVIDIITGLLNAIKNKTWSSTVMREGLFHKMGFILFIALALLCDYGQQFIDIGFTIPITESVLIYVIVTELGSCIENLAGINPELIPEKLRSIFIKTKEV